jgi:hypothetical protein
MPIIDLQKRLHEAGRIRIGRQIESRGGKKRPAALDVFRFTSPDRQRIADIAKLYGGTVTTWDAPSGRKDFEVISESDKVPVVVPPSAMAFSQSYELWSAGGCKRRCDGVTETLSEQPCLCEPENRQCEPHTRLSVMLRDVPGLGLWRLDTQGYYASVELWGAVEIISLAAGQGHMLPATLRLDKRTSKRAEEGVRHYVVPVLDIEVTSGQLLMGTVAVVDAGDQRLSPPAALTPVPDSGAPPPTIAEQVAASEAIPSRRRATPIKATGITPRTAAQRGPMPEPADPDDRFQGISPQARAETLAAEQNTFSEPVPSGAFAETARQSEEDAYAAIDAAREAAQNTQDQPRMVTHGQLTKLGILLTNRGFAKGPTYDTVEDARIARLTFCSTETKRLMPDSPWAGRPLGTSKDLTFDEANVLINMLEADEKTAKQPEPQPDPQPVEQPSTQPVEDSVAVEQPSAQPVEDTAADLIAGLDPVDTTTETDEEYYERLEREAADGIDPNQLNLL